MQEVDQTGGPGVSRQLRPHTQQLMIDSATIKKELEMGFRVGAYVAEPQLQRISKDSGEVRVEPKVMDVLVLLAVQPGRTVTREEFMEAVWSDTVVTDDALLRCISELRKIFGDDARDPRYIETIRRRGYRLIAQVEIVSRAGRSLGPLPGPEFVPDATAPAAEQTPADPPVEPSVGLSLEQDGAASHTARRPPSRYGLWPLYAWFAFGAFALLLSGLAASRLWTDREVSSAPVHYVPFTSYPGVESDPNISPDGSRVAFVWDQGDGGGADVYVKQVGVETPLRLTSGPASDTSPAWSPDGMFLAFVRSGAPENGIYLVPAIGGTERMLVDLGEREGRSVAWSPRGDYLAYTAPGAALEPVGIWLLSLETGESHVLTEPPGDYLGDLELAFSPDGQWLAFVRSIVEKVDNIYIVSVAGRELKRLTFDHAEITGLDWTADGREILYSSDREGAFSLWRVSVSGGTPRWIAATGEGSGLHQPSIARGGTRLAFMQRLQETNIWYYERPATGRTDSLSSRRPVVASTRWDSNPALSPDGSRLAFVSNRTGSYEIWMSKRDGTEPIQLTQFGGSFTTTPAWSPDGKRIAFASRGKENIDVYVVDIMGGRPRQITAAGSNDRSPSWSRDGAWIYFGSNRNGAWNVWKVPAEGGEAVQVTTGGGIAAREDPQGGELLYVKGNAPGIWSMPIGGGPERRIVAALQPYDWGNWFVTEEGLFYVRRDASGPVLVLVHTASGEEEVITPLQRLPRHPAIALSSDGRELFYTRVDRTDGDILLAEEFK